MNFNVGNKLPLGPGGNIACSSTVRKEGLKAGYGIPEVLILSEANLVSAHRTHPIVSLNTILCHACAAANGSDTSLDCEKARCQLQFSALPVANSMTDHGDFHDRPWRLHDRHSSS